MIASLPMYDFVEITESTNSLWSGIRDAAFELGARGLPDKLTRPTISLHDHWLDPEIVLSQSCGLPALEILTERQPIIGSFAFSAGIAGEPGFYQSLLVCRAADPRHLEGLKGFVGCRAVANDSMSLSGFVSLGVALAEARVEVRSLAFSTAHVTSCEMVRDNFVDLACVDAHTYELLHAHRPASIEGLAVIGYGPKVASTPVFTARAELAETLRQAIPLAIAGLSKFDRTALRIEGFTRWGIEAFNGVEKLAEIARRQFGDLAH